MGIYNTVMGFNIKMWYKGKTFDGSYDTILQRISKKGGEQYYRIQYLTEEYIYIQPIPLDVLLILENSHQQIN